MAGQASGLQGHDRLAVTHPSSSHAERSLNWLSCDNRCTRYTTPFVKQSLRPCENHDIAPEIKRSGEHGECITVAAVVSSTELDLQTTRKTNLEVTRDGCYSSTCWEDLFGQSQVASKVYNSKGECICGNGLTFSTRKLIAYKSTMSDEPSLSDNSHTCLKIGVLELEKMKNLRIKQESDSNNRKRCSWRNLPKSDISNNCGFIDLSRSVITGEGPKEPGGFWLGVSGRQLSLEIFRRHDSRFQKLSLRQRQIPDVAIKEPGGALESFWKRVRVVFKRAKTWGTWETYHEALALYNHKVQTAKRLAWKKLSTGIDNVQGSVRLHELLEKIPSRRLVVSGTTRINHSAVEGDLRGALLTYSGVWRVV
ncbi:hypothetical protein J6590_076569 [Homalodisca vitripennis]|nr:hypothetical protein J6590_076569 [Homalodisca vitripennis]